jgi:hypothetical protein
MGIFKKEEFDISSTMPHMQKYSTNLREADDLVNQLGPPIKFNKKQLVLFNESEQYDLYKLFEKSTTLNNNDNNFSETSPFISSDVYNQLLNKIKSNNQSGGARTNSKTNYKKHKKSNVKSSDEYKRNEDKDDDHDDDFEDESSTSSSDDYDDSDNKRTLQTELKKKDKNIDPRERNIDLEEKKDETDSFSGISAGSYLSSSAHTDGSNSTDSADSADSANSSNSNSYNSNSLTSSTVSSRNHKKRSKSRNYHYSDSVDTSDINILSLDD